LTDETQTDDRGPDPEETVEKGLLCPRDGATLNAMPYEADIEVDECPKCDGRWLDEGELNRIQNTVERDYSQRLREHPEFSARAYDMSREMSEAPMACPVCGQDMEREEYAHTSQVVIDVCAACNGVWLDAGELERLEVFFERAQADAPFEIPWYVRLSLLFKGRQKNKSK
jgi:Zn-finger nucleic acid-binding protein